MMGTDKGVYICSNMVIVRGVYIASVISMDRGFGALHGQRQVHWVSCTMLFIAQGRVFVPNYI
jgi:hypothetical protein